MRINPWKITTFGSLGALAMIISLGLVDEAKADPEPQPHMRAALTALKTARSQLNASSHDKGGHRVKALLLTNQAIDQVEKGIAHDNQN